MSTLRPRGWFLPIKTDAQVAVMAKHDAWAEARGGWPRVEAIAEVAESQEQHRRSQNRILTARPPTGPLANEAFQLILAARRRAA